MSKEAMKLNDAGSGYSDEVERQDVPPGYKRTEVGVIPEDWPIMPLGALGVFSKGQGIRKNECGSGDIPCVRYGELYTHHNNIIHDFYSYISAEVAKQSKKIKKGDILFAGSGETKNEIGKSIAFIGNEEAYAGGDIVIFTPNTGDSTFFGYLLNAPNIADQKASKGQGDAVVHISAAALSSIKIPFPPTEKEQHAIANALSDVDNLIGALDALIAKKRAIKQAAIQQLLTGKTRLPGFSGEWETKRLGDIAELRNGYAFKSITYSESGIYRIVTISNVQDGRMDLAECSTIINLPNDLQTHHRLKIGDLLISMTGNVGRVCRVVKNNCLLNQRVGLIVPANVTSDYLFQLLSRRHFLTAMIGKVKGGAQGNLSKDDIMDYVVTLPSNYKEQTAIATVLSDMDTEITALKQRRDKTQQIKQGMMQQLLTGRIRLVNPKEAA